MIARLSTALDGINFGRAQLALNGLLQSEAIAAPSPVPFYSGGNSLNIRRRKSTIKRDWPFLEEPLILEMPSIAEPKINQTEIRAKNKRDEFFILH